MCNKSFQHILFLYTDIVIVVIVIVIAIINIIIITFYGVINLLARNDIANLTKDEKGIKKDTLRVASVQLSQFAWRLFVVAEKSVA